jgi:hypothetical protein
MSESSSRWNATSVARTRPRSARASTPSARDHFPQSERANWWPCLVAKYPGYEFFQQRAKDREIPIVLFEPVG